VFARSIYLLAPAGILAAFGCQATPDAPAQAPLPASVTVHDPRGTTIAELRPGHPCRATIGPVELIIGGPPLVAQVGDTRWSGDTGSNGTTISRGTEAIARVFPVGDPTRVSVIDPQGVALLRVTLSGGDATVANAAGQTVRRLHTKVGGEIVSDPPAASATGTNDLVLVALLSAPELAPEVRMLAACERVLVKGS
jgi:hypothetical protein